MSKVNLPSRGLGLLPGKGTLLPSLGLGLVGAIIPDLGRSIIVRPVPVPAVERARRSSTPLARRDGPVGRRIGSITPFPPVRNIDVERNTTAFVAAPPARIAAVARDNRAVFVAGQDRTVTPARTLAEIAAFRRDTASDDNSGV